MVSSKWIYSVCENTDEIPENKQFEHNVFFQI